MIINGKLLAEEVLFEVKINIEKLISELNKVPTLCIISVGNDDASEVYIRNKVAACEKVGIKIRTCKLPQFSNDEEIISLIESLNEEENITAILVQLPLPAHIDKSGVIDKIIPSKDVDAITSSNCGKILCRNYKILPCTAAGIIYILQKNHIDIAGKECVVVGRSEIVGKPTALALLNLNATVTICHSKTQNLKEICLRSDILVSAVGKAAIITRDMVKPGSVVIDVGINRKDGKLCGDVDFEEVKNIASIITPVPGGVGPMTVAFLIKNIFSLFQEQTNPNR
ncbi:MAG: bifunctional 5,10-methylenetetrahydrofolate dehydrogenase/5,10-methenyltetrahydrofolate cyclohydrolase [Oscillospiraceae bacterium]|jgi:methylenetetrahydrofolate dehydrogenase (NADP+)/methenyltetrahydrofolate cyclohydrolase|nr:bifunctional 5,10-methylenetetrahydrofolate dehydrogenase/5,10-methenyltetrahydrofolate cyclohydrolase [Oscillospiraceae bacterium]